MNKSKVGFILFMALCLVGCNTDKESSSSSLNSSSVSGSSDVSSSIEDSTSSSSSSSTVQSSSSDSSTTTSSSSSSSSTGGITSSSSSTTTPSSSSSSSSIVISKYTIEVTNGTGDGTYNEGEQVTITADLPDEGYEFEKWINKNTQTVFSTENPYTFEASQNLSLEAIYKKQTFQVTVIGGVIKDTSLSTGTFEYQDEVTIEAENRPSNRFVEWQDEEGNKISDANPYTFSIEEDITLVATFETVVAKPNTVEDLETIFSTSLQQEKKIKQVVASKAGGYSSQAEDYTTTFYQNAVYAAGKKYVSSYSIYDFVEFKGMHGTDKYVEVLDVTSDYYDKFSCFAIVDEVEDDEKQITLQDATTRFEIYGLTAILGQYLSNQLKSENRDGDLVVVDTTDGFKVTLKGHEIITTIYHVYELSVEFTFSGFIKNIELVDANYVKANMYDESSNSLKPDATARNTEITTYQVSAGAREELPEDMNPSKYFISSYDVQISVSYGSTIYVNEEKPYMPLGSSWYKSSSMTMVNVLPETAMEDKTLEYISSSHPEVIGEDPSSSSKLKALQEGETVLTFRSKGGIEKQFTIQVQAFAPKTITIQAADKMAKDGKIELTATFSPTNADTEVEWSVDKPEIANIVYEDHKVYLQGQNQDGGNVVVTCKAKKKDLEGKEISATKTIYVSPGELSTDELTNILVGKWSYKSGSSVFEVTFNDDGTYSVVDNYRSASKITNTGNYQLTTTEDKDFVIFDETKCNASTLAEGYVVSTSDRVYDKEANKLNGEIVDLHFIIEKDGSGLTMHFKVPEKASGTQSYKLTKEA